MLRLGPLAVRLRPRALFAGLVLLAGLAVTSVLALGGGEVELTGREVLAVLVGQGEPGPEFIVGTLRLPRLLTGIAVGAALGASGALLQGMARNPLVSPDIIGFTSGAATGAISALILGADSLFQIGLGALVGGAAASVLVYVLAHRHGGTGTRLVLIGIGVTAALVSVNTYLISKAPVHDAVAAQAWLVGGLNNRGWDHVLVMAGALAVLAPAAAVAAARLNALELGDTTARALGANAESDRRLLLCTSVGLAAVATAVAGPVAFVAFAAPHLVRPLTAATRPGPFTAAGMGALLLAGCDVATQRLFRPVPLPVGVLTAALGGLYLVWVLAFGQRGRL
ncbi:FecCD family ABC transporter permease [Jatrophihabitans sp.]|uniref:FecCD family ABC transporter permease n=1 Tax=Jatrophihabitans sp. TaxID=1932789 RepID=UPI002CD47D24|nr:iron chelate uptake ABC transporter family permease subunit [Jatrophihabitans sp.]